MLLKPSSCDGCPAKGLSAHWVPDEYVPGAAVTVMLQNPGASEVEGKRFMGHQGGRETWEPHPPAPAIGKTGYFQEQRLFPKAGLQRGENVSIGNVIRCRFGSSNDLPPLSDPMLRQAILHCQAAHFRPPASTRLFVAEGEYALWALTGEFNPRKTKTDDEMDEAGRSISTWRGWLLPFKPPVGEGLRLPVHRGVYTPLRDDTPVLATYHTAFLFRSPWERTAAQRDWTKVGEFLNGKWPEPLPRIERRAPAEWPALAAWDTEFGRETKHLVRYSLAYRERMVGVPRVWVVEAGFHSLGLPALPTVRPTVIMHNSPADLRYLPAVLGTADVDVIIEDSMFQHSLLWSDLNHNLGYVGSLYARINRWKHLAENNPTEYSAGDALGTWDAWVGMNRELERDVQTRALYRQFLPLIPFIARSEAVGSRVNRDRVKAVIKRLGAEQQEATRAAQAWCGYPINVGSSAQVGRWVYGVEGIRTMGRGRK